MRHSYNRMVAASLNRNTLRSPERLLVWAFVISLSLHVVGYGGFELGHRYGWWKKDLMPSWLKTTKERMAEIARQQPKPPPQEPPLMFVEVDPNAAPVTAPKDAKYYSSHNSRAADTSVKVESEKPKINGKQTHVPQALNAQPSKATPLQPTPPKPKAEPVETKPKPATTPQPVGDLALAKTEKPAEVAPPQHVRPRTIAEAQALQALATGQKIKQDGGLGAHMNTDAFDAKATPFGEYDWKLVQIIKDRWLTLLNTKSFSRDHTGRVVVEFRLLSNGNITGMKILSTEVDDVLTYVCESAINQPAPYEPWPSDMRRYFGQEYRDVQFTFWYE
jgi:hypothetical protein